MWDLPENPLGHTVGFSNAEAMTGVVEQLAATGRRRIAFIGADDNSDVRGSERCKGVVATAARLNLPEVTVVGIGQAPVSMTEGARAVERMGDQLSEFDALVCVSDTVAFGVQSACQRMGIRIPEDLAITGFGAFEISATSNPRITTVDVFAYDIGVATGNLISRVLSEEGVRQPETINTGSRFLQGETS